MTSKALVSTIAIAAAVAVPVAEAHTLSKSTAKREAAKVGAKLGDSVGGSPVYQCTRRSRHVVVCEVSVVSLDGALCVTRVRVAYRDHDSRTVRRRVLSGPDCEPPELSDVL